MSIRGIFVQTIAFDAARPTEIFNALALIGWAQLLLSTPDVFARPSFSGFWGPQDVWALIMAAIAAAQIFAMIWSVRGRHTIRFLAMVAAAGVWTTFAVSFGQGDVPSSGTRTYAAAAIVTGLMGLFLAWISSAPRSAS